MKVFYGLNDIQESLPNPVITIGNFDGVHLGHQKIFQDLKNEAKKIHGTDIIITFFPHPLKVLFPDKAPHLITTLDERLRLIRACGNEVIVCIPFTRAFSNLSAERFVQEILVEKFGVQEVLVGQDARFGKDREGDIDFLRKSAKRFHFSVREIEPVQVRGMETSSTKIRRCVEKGELRQSAAMLGRLYGITGTVCEGDKRGKSLGFPTANLSTDAELLPPNGVYAVWSTVGDTVMPGVANLGVKPTFSGKQFSIEVHLFDFDENIYGESIRMDFVERIREERTFPNAQALIDEMNKDSQKAKEILQEDPSSILKGKKGGVEPLPA